MIKVYVAGAYSANNVMGVLGNIRRGLQLGAEVAEQGLYPFIPWLDVLVHTQVDLSLDFCYKWSMSFLESCDVLLVVEEGHEKSKGTQAEIARAKELGKPVFFCLNELLDWVDEQPHLCTHHKPAHPFSAPSMVSSWEEVAKSFHYVPPKPKHDALVALHKELCDEARGIMSAKNNDYTAGSEDRFANFRMSENLGVAPEIALLVRCMDKFQRIRTFVEKGQLQVKSEPVKDAILDVINYMILLAGMVNEKTGHKVATKMR